MGLIAGIFLAVLAAPFYGVHLFITGFGDEKIWGAVIAIIGVILGAALFH